MKILIVNIGLREDSNRKMRENDILDVIKDDVIVDVNNDGSNSETYNMNFDVELENNTQSLLDELYPLVDYIETTEMDV